MGFAKAQDELRSAQDPFCREAATKAICRGRVWREREQGRNKAGEALWADIPFYRMNGLPRSKRSLSTSNDEHQQQQQQDNGDIIKKPKTRSTDHEEPFVSLQDDVIRAYVKLEPLPPKKRRNDHNDGIISTPLTDRERQELQKVYALDEWPADWAGNLALLDQEIPNPTSLLLAASSTKKSSTTTTTLQQSIWHWAQHLPAAHRIALNLLRHVYACSETPEAAKRILESLDNDNDDPAAAAAAASMEALESVARRVSYGRFMRSFCSCVLHIIEALADDFCLAVVVLFVYIHIPTSIFFLTHTRVCFFRCAFTHTDPAVLRQDGWTTQRSATPVGATAGPYRIGAKIRWQDSDAVVIAYVHDADIGDLWKAFWIQEQMTFDLEAEEVMEAQRKWERRYLTQQQSSSSSSSIRTSARFLGSAKFTVKGISRGIVLAASLSKGARPGVYWPARVVHASERVSASNKRSSARQKVDVVFLAPYWNPHQAVDLRGGRSVAAASDENTALFQVENIDATSEMIKEYTFRRLDLAELRMAFRFTGLPKSVFGRYLDSHRLALGLQKFAMEHIMPTSDLAAAGLLETHIMSVQAPLFPAVVLHLPFEHILAQLRQQSDASSAEGEPILDLKRIVDAMEPPNCWGGGQENGNAVVSSSPEQQRRYKPMTIDSPKGEQGVEELFESLCRGLPLLAKTMGVSPSSPSVAALQHSFGLHLALLVDSDSASHPIDDIERRKLRTAFIRTWAAMKRQGTEVLSPLPQGKALLMEWRVAAERMYRRSVIKYSTTNATEQGVSAVLSDHRCNGHRTETGCFERPVRLAAALKGAKMAGAGTNPSIRLVTEIDPDYMERVERTVLPMAHSQAYLERMKSRCAAAKSETDVLILTDDSSGNGGEDTSKWMQLEWLLGLIDVCLICSRCRRIKRDMASICCSGCDCRCRCRQDL